MIKTIPLRDAVLCESCLVITASKGECCDYCGARTLARLQAMLELERVPAAWLEALEVMNR